MRIILIIFTGIFYGLIASALLYTLNPSNIAEESQKSDYQDGNIFQRYRIEADFHTNKNNCYDVAVKCPPGVQDCNCHAKCGLGFTETFVLDNSETIFNSQLLEPGKYCLPQETVHCDRKLGYLVFSGHKFSCICKHPEMFGGPSCDTRQNCLRGILRHKTTGEILDVHNFKPDYYCSCDLPDNKGNKMINLPGNPFECFSDPCTQWLTEADPEVGFDPKSGNCNCGDPEKTRIQNYFEAELRSPCTACFISYTSTGQLIFPARCASVKSDLNTAPPCKEYKTLKHECERIVTPISITDMHAFQGFKLSEIYNNKIMLVKTELAPSYDPKKYSFILTYHDSAHAAWS